MTLAPINSSLLQPPEPERSAHSALPTGSTLQILAVTLVTATTAQMLSEDSDNEDIHQLTINEHFAKAYEYRKEREELAKRAFRLAINSFV